MRPVQWTKRGRTKEGQLARAIRGDLVRHVGGSPSAAQEILISRITMLLVHLAHLDERAMRDGGLSPHASREYLSWHSTVARSLRVLGLKGEAAKPPTLAEILAAPPPPNAATRPASAAPGPSGAAGSASAPGTAPKPPAGSALPAAVRDDFDRPIINGEPE